MPEHILREDLIYRALFEQANDAIYVLDLQGRYLTFNQRGADLLGYTPDELQQLTFRDVTHPNEYDNIESILRRLRDGEQVPVYERVFRRKDGMYFYGEVNAHLVRNEDGTPLHIHSMVRDISDRRRVEDELHYYAVLMENVSDAIISTDMEGVIMSWNQAAEKIYGWKEDEVIGKPLDAVLTSNLYDQRQAQVKEQYITRGYWSSEIRQQRRDGKLIDVLTSVSLLRDSRGKPVGTVAVNHEITQRKKIEAELQTRAERMAALRQIDSEISSSLELSQVLRYSLNAAVSLAGADAGFIALLEDNAIQKIHTYGKYNYLEEKQSGLRLYGVAKRTTRRLQPELVENAMLDPDYVADIDDTQAVMAFPLFSRDRIIGVLLLETDQQGHFTHDIFEFLNLLVNRLATAIDNAWLYNLSREHLEELRKLYTQVTKLEQLKTDMIRIASHDLRNPVGLVNGYVELLRIDLVDRVTDAEMDYIESIAKAIARMQRIIDDILSLERIQRVADDQIAERVNISALARKVVHNHISEAEAKAIKVHFDLVDEDQEPVVSGDPAQLYEALSNLISNAVKYTSTDGHIFVSAWMEHGAVYLTVRDTGYGIPKDQQKRLFEPFFRAQSDATEAIKGIGLGLHLVKNIIERHNGKVLFESVYGEGSTFGFRLPLTI